jgi:hypothetical protein
MQSGRGGTIGVYAESAARAHPRVSMSASALTWIVAEATEDTGWPG